MEKKTYDWNAIYQDFLKSGLSRYGYCKERGLSSATLYKHFDRIEAELTGMENNGAETVVDFVPAEIIPDIQSELMCDENDESETGQDNSSITLEIERMRISLSPGFDKALLRDVLEVVRELC